MSAKTVIVYTVLHDDNGPGRYGDGLATYRTRWHNEAWKYAQGKTLYGRPVKIQKEEVPKRTAERWGV